MIRIAAHALLLVCLASVSAAAQVVTSSTGAINGAVTDDTDGVLPGVTVSLRSPQLIGTRESVTGEQGRYQFAAVPPGQYAVTFTMPGFTTVIRSDVRVSLGFTATVNAKLQLATQQETITVSGASPVVDTAATSMTNNFDVETMSNLPTARDYIALMAETPAVAMSRIDVGGSAAMSETQFTIYGMAAGNSMNQISNEGITGFQINQYNDFGSFQEVQITTAGHTAEMAVPGVMTNISIKAGGNEFHGGFYGDYEKGSWGSRNIDERQLGLGVSGGPGLDARDTNRVDTYTDVNANIGGYILKDKIWWFGSARYNASDVRFVNYPVKPQHTSIRSLTTKWTYNVSQNNKLVGFVSRNNKSQPERFVDKVQIQYSADETLDQSFLIGQWKGEYNSVLSNAMFLDVRYGAYYKDFYMYSRAPGKPLYIDTATQERFGGVPASLSTEPRPQLNGSFSYFKNGWGASHNFKVGWEAALYKPVNEQFGRVSRESLGDPNPPPDLEYHLINGVPNEVMFRETPNLTVNRQWNYSAYIKDVWALNDRFSFNLGLRFDRYRNGYPNVIHPASLFNPTEDVFPANSDVFSFNNFGPRLGVIWNVQGNGATLVKANYGAYAWRPVNPVPGQNPNAPVWSRTYAWTDRNGDREWQAGEEGRLINQTGGSTNERIDPNWKQDVTREIVTVLERELRPNFGVRTGFVWRGNTNPQVVLNPNRPFAAYTIPVTVSDPGPDGRLGTGDDGAPLQAWNLDPAYLDVPLVNMTTHNPNTGGEDHYTWEVSGTKRASNNWSMNASYSRTWSQVPPVVTNPNDFIGTESDGRRHYANWAAKLASTIQLPHDLNISTVVRHQSGDPFGRTIRAVMNYGNQTIQVEPEVTRRVTNVTVADLRLEKGFTVVGSRAAFFLDLFNMLNANPDESIVQSSGATFLRPIVVIGPRVMRLGMKFDW